MGRLNLKNVTVGCVIAGFFIIWRMIGMHATLYFSIHVRLSSPLMTVLLIGDAQGKTSKEYLEIKKMAFLEPKLLHAMLKSLADSIGDYANYQVRPRLSCVCRRYGGDGCHDRNIVRGTR